MKLTCLKCKHEWEYKGASKYYATCPHCYNKVRIGGLSLSNATKALRKRNKHQPQITTKKKADVVN